MAEHHPREPGITLSRETLGITVALVTLIGLVASVAGTWHLLSYRMEQLEAQLRRSDERISREEDRRVALEKAGSELEKKIQSNAADVALRFQALELSSGEIKTTLQQIRADLAEIRREGIASRAVQQSQQTGPRR